MNFANIKSISIPSGNVQKITVGGQDIWTSSSSSELINASLSFTSKDNRILYSTEEQVWEQNGVKFTNNKADSDRDVFDGFGPIRIYANSEIIVEGAGMTKIEFLNGSNSYANTLSESIGTIDGATVTVSGLVVTIEFETAVQQFKVSSLTGQCRLNAILVNATN